MPGARDRRLVFLASAFLAAGLLRGAGAAGLDDPQAQATAGAALEPGEELPGGAATSRKSVNTLDAFSHASGNLEFKREFDFKIGNGIFTKLWVSAPASTKSSDGLGPLYNAKSCQSCHIKDGRGHPPRANWPESDAISMLLRLSIPGEAQPSDKAEFGVLADTKPEPTYGTQLQDLSIQGQIAEGKIHVDYAESEVVLADGEKVSLRKPAYSIDNLGYGPLHPDTQISPRIAPPMIGLGLLEAIPEAAILARADPGDKNGDGISGRPNWVRESGGGAARLGRFGWKAGNPSIAQQSAEAFAGDIGISSPLLDKPSGECTEKQPACLGAPNGNSPPETGAEINKELFDLVVFYSQNLAVPARRDPAAAEVLQGKRLFSAIGCAACHAPSSTTGDAPNAPHLSNQTIWPYTDLLLHDMGEGLADNRPEREANGREWRTPPLWGIGLTQTVNGHTFFLHDGRARSIVEAILWHSGEAQTSRNAFAALPKVDRDALIAFVNSL
ncbi:MULTISPECIES: di-heme oxidoredictase family protein [Rhodomicrobium]|uniref:di-heme oxidoreductase family protein n=1 Tax=Rhodomicrobium TaxID=1068 RepID=UPI000B4B5997|nr:MULTISPECIES: di-heme oxidoredictase family protein [Rhodomicrobium]